MWITYQNKEGAVVRALTPVSGIQENIDLICYWNVAKYLNCEFKPRLRPVTKDSGGSPGFVTFHNQWWLN